MLASLKLVWVVGKPALALAQRYCDGSGSVFYDFSWQQGRLVHNFLEENLDPPEYTRRQSGS